MEKRENILETVNKKKCKICGTCIGVCPTSAIEKEYNKQKGFYDIKVDNDKCTNCTMCIKCCPAAEKAECSESQLLIGEYKEIMLCASSDEITRHECTSGGAITTIVKEMLLAHEIDEAFLVGEDAAEPMQTKMYHITLEELSVLNERRRFSGRYVCYPAAEVLKKINQNTKTLIVGLPCQIAGIKKALELKNIENILLLGIACSGAISYKASILAINKLQKNKKSKSELRYYYRGNGWPGYNELIDCNGEGVRQRHQESFFNALFTSKIFTNSACKYCTDQLAESADISFFDYWNGDEIKNENEGKSGVIIRTGKGNKIIEGLIKNNKLIKYSILTEEQVVLSQRIPILYKKKINHIKTPKMISIYYGIAGMIRSMKIYNIIPEKVIRKMGNLYNKLVIKYTREGRK